MEKTRDLVKKIRDTKGTYHAKMSLIKDCIIDKLIYIYIYTHIYTLHTHMYTCTYKYIHLHIKNIYVYILQFIVERCFFLSNFQKEIASPHHLGSCLTSAN